MPLTILKLDALGQAENILAGMARDSEVEGLSPYADEIRRLRELKDFSGKAEEWAVLYPAGGKPKRLFLSGLGEVKKFGLEQVRRAVGRGIKKAQERKARTLAIHLDSFVVPGWEISEIAQAAALAATLAAYRFREFKHAEDGEESREPIRINFFSENPRVISHAVQVGEIIGEAANFARTLADRPGNVLFPEVLAGEAKRLAADSKKFSLRVIRRKELVKGGFGALVGVGAGSVHPPVLIELAYHGGGAKQPPVALVGKGITFDSGGISLKPSAKLDEMRFDMSGAAAVLGILRAAARLGIRQNLVGVIAAAENLPSGSAYRPGDILTSLSGKTIEVLNTDAEGRLVLADALTYALRRQPGCVVDLATLTGAVVVALGHAASGLLSNQAGLAEEIKAAADASGEKVWPLPLWDEYRELVKSEVADVANIGSKPGAGTIVGAVFLEKFVGETPWAHLDIAGTAYGDGGPLYAKGATGAGVRLLVEWLLQRDA